MRNISILTVTVFLGIFASVACESTEINEANNAAIADEELIFLYEEEKVAMDIYNHFEAVYGITPYVHISDSEKSHFDQMEGLLISLGILDETNVIRTEAGIFINEDLQALYDELKARGDESLIEALKVSAFIEEHDITGLENVLVRADTEEIKETMTYLIAASKNHLRAFNRNLGNRGVDYEPVLLDSEYFDDIINARTSCCQSNEKGNGKGKGKQQCNH